MKTEREKFSEGRLFIGATIFLYLVLAGVLLYLPLTRTQGAVEQLLIHLVPKVLWLNFLLILIGLYLCRRDIAGAFRELWPETGTAGIDQTDCPELPSWRRQLGSPGLWLIMLCLAGLLIVIFVAPQTHRIYFDEDIYGNMAQNIAYRGQTGMANYGLFEYGEYFVNWIMYNKDPSGWPFLLSLVFQLFGLDENYLFYLNNLLFTGGIIVTFFITRLIAGGIFPALLAALIFALIPHNLVWSNTGAAETSAAFWGGVTVLCTLAYLRTGARRRLFLLAVVAPFACYLRPESALVCLWVLAALATGMWRIDRTGRGFSRSPLVTREFWALALISLALIIPHIWHLYAMSGQSWGASGAKFAVSFFQKNLSTNGFYYLNNKEFPVLFTLLALAGFLAWRNRASQDEERDGYLAVTLLLFWFLLFWGIFLFFYAGGYKYGADVRFALLSFLPLAVLAGLGGEALRQLITRKLPLGRPATVTAILVLVLLFSWLKFLPLIRLVSQEAWGARYDHHYAREFVKGIPNRSIVLTHNPTMFLLWGYNAIQAYAGINHPDIIKDLMTRYNGHVYFHRNYWCNALNDGNRSVCDGIGLKYNLEPVATAREQTYEYGLYRMSFK